jgi:hypothetical protein
MTRPAHLVGLSYSGGVRSAMLIPAEDRVTD